MDSRLQESFDVTERQRCAPKQPSHVERRTVELDALSWDAAPYPHPVLGPLTAGQMLTLGQTHTAYHTRQMESLQRDPAFPAASTPWQHEICRSADGKRRCVG